MNSKAFTPEEVEKNLHLDLIKYFLDHNKKNDESYYEFLVTTDGYCTIINWVDRDYNPEITEEKFVCIDEDRQVVAEEVSFPDNHYELCYNGEGDNVLNEWLKEHPEYKKNEWGMWVNTEEKV